MKTVFCRPIFKPLILVLALLLFESSWKELNAQNQEFRSSTNAISVVPSQEGEKITKEIKRIVFVPTIGKDYKTLIISAEKGIDDILTFPLTKYLGREKELNVEKQIYQSISKDFECNIILSTTNNQLTSVTISKKLGEKTLNWIFKEITPYFD